MNKINFFEFKSLKFKSRGAGMGKPVSPYMESVKSLRLGEGFLITNDEWNYKTRPTQYFTAFQKKLGIKLTIRTLKDDSGWALIRTA